MPLQAISQHTTAGSVTVLIVTLAGQEGGTGLARHGSHCTPHDGAVFKVTCAVTVVATKLLVSPFSTRTVTRSWTSPLLVSTGTTASRLMGAELLARPDSEMSGVVLSGVVTRMVHGSPGPLPSSPVTMEYSSFGFSEPWGTVMVLSAVAGFVSIHVACAAAGTVMSQPARSDTLRSCRAAAIVSFMKG